MDKFQAFKVFVTVAENLSFSKSAEVLRMPNASVSTAIQELESNLGVQLLERTTRRVALTQEGASFLERCKQLLDDVEQSESMFRIDAPQIKGKVRVEMSVGVAQIVIPHLPSFFEQYPEIEIEISSRDYFVDLVREGIDFAIRGGGPSTNDYIEKELGAIVCVTCVSPAYIEKFGKPKLIDDLTNHILIHYTQTLGSKNRGFEFFDGEKTRFVKMKSSITVNSVSSYYEACLAGLGIAQLPLIGIAKSLKEGSLIEVLPKFRAEPYSWKLIYHEGRILSARSRILMDLMTHIIEDAAGGKKR